MSARVEYTRLSGGLDLSSGAMQVAPGRLVECMNFEQVFGRQGYRRIDGYERFDGSPQPSDAGYSGLRFTGGSVEIEVGEVVQGAAFSATVALVQVHTGDWASGDAAGRLVLAAPMGTFVADEAIQVGGVTRATADGGVVPGSLSNPDNTQDLLAAQQILRQRIMPVPGSGPIRGVAVYRGAVFALRDAADGQTAVLWKSSATGWEQVRAGLLPGGTLSSDVANFSGASTTMALFGCDGKNRPWRYDGIAFTPMAPIYASQGTSNTIAAIGTGSHTLNIQESGRSWAAGDVLLASDQANAANRMVGTVTSYDSGTSKLTLDVTQALGSGSPAAWEIGRADFADKPYLLRAHRDRLFLAYPLGQLQASNLGDPMVYTTTAALFGLGDSITGLASLRGAVLGVFCAGKINILEGTTPQDWSMAPNSQSSGARLGTLQEIGGNALFLDERGLTCLQATQKFGGFEPAIFSRDIKPALDALTDRVVGSRLCKAKFQYRLYFQGGDVLTATILSPNAELQPSDVAFTRQVYPHAPVCVASGAMTEGEEGFFFGTADGWVMREDRGTSFDGQPIASVMRLHFNQLKSPENKKRFTKLSLEIDAPGIVQVRFRQQFDLDNGQYRPSVTGSAQALGGGGRWEASNWDEFRWSLPVQTMAEANIDGVGRSMGMLFWHESESDLPFSLQGMVLQYIPLGLAR